uniref:Metalloprotease TIKI homolog n=1 Tax=Meloidogyne floridensis TaxID=298350 RepID=A0A915NVB1_9BILA
MWIENIVNKDLLQLRNKQWANQIDELISKTPNKTFMFTFSVDHFIGKNNLLDLLRERGYQIEQIIKIPKIDKKILKQIKEDKISSPNKTLDNLIEEKIKNRTLKNNLNQTKLNKNKTENIKRKNKLMETTTNSTTILPLISSIGIISKRAKHFLCKFYTWKRRSDEYRVEERKFSLNIEDGLEIKENEDSEKFIILGKNDVKYIVNGNINKET